MAAKAEISWKRHTENGERLEIYAHHFGKRWSFYVRQRRYDRWEPLKQPSLEDWLKLLEAVRRRVARRLLRPEEVERVEQTIRENFPEAHLD